MRKILNKKTSNSLIIFGVLSTYFGFSHDSSNFIPSEIKYTLGILALILGVLGHILNLRANEKL